jgi:ubiquinone/menaquinone biosynthesis C-methylase UbiE
MSTQDVTHFTNVDQTADPGFFIHFLQEGNKQPDAIGWKSSILDGLGLRPGMRVLDVGCGLGDDAVELAALVGPRGHVTGVDLSQSLITEAFRRFADRGLPLEFEVGDVKALRFADESFDAVRAERVLMHIPDASGAVAEMWRVLRPGGRMAALDFDWETQFCDSPYKETTRKIALSFCDSIRRLDRTKSSASLPRSRNDQNLYFTSHGHGHLRFPSTLFGWTRCPRGCERQTR